MAGPDKDDARSVMADPRAPSDERFDAQIELAKSHRPNLSDLMPSPDALRVIDYINQGLADQAELRKSAQVIRFPGENRTVARKGMQSVYVDDLQIFTDNDARNKPSPLGFGQLRELVEATPILAAIVGTRIRQIGRFCQPSEDGGEGFEVRHMEKGHKLTGAEKERARLITRFIQNNGWEFNPRKRKAMKRESFAQFMRKSVRDSLSMDACPIELEWKRDRSQGLDGFYAVDGATIRLCTDQGYEGDKDIFALQEVEGRLATAYTRDDLLYEVRNPRTDVRLAGYGFGETEQLVRVVTGFLNAMNMNIAGFDNNAIPKGVLHLSGDYDAGDIADFKRRWNAQVSGINGRWTVPVMVSREGETKASFEKFGVDFDEMMFAKWMTFLTSLACAIFGMSPDEINFESFAASKSSLSGDDTEEKLTSSRDTGLHPDMSFYEAMMTDFIVSEFDTDLCFRWVGLKPEDRAWNHETDKLILTVDEMRAQRGYDSWPDKDSKLGTAPVNASLLSAWEQEQQAANPPPGGEFGAGAPPPAPPSNGDDEDYGEESDGGEAGGGQTQGGQNDDAAAGAAGAADQEGAQPEFGGGGPGGAEFGKAFRSDLTPIYTIGDE